MYSGVGIAFARETGLVKATMGVPLVDLPAPQGSRTLAMQLAYCAGALESRQWFRRSICETVQAGMPGGVDIRSFQPSPQLRFLEVSPGDAELSFVLFQMCLQVRDMQHAQMVAGELACALLCAARFTLQKILPGLQSQGVVRFPRGLSRQFQRMQRTLEDTPEFRGIYEQNLKRLPEVFQATPELRSLLDVLS